MIIFSKNVRTTACRIFSPIAGCSPSQGTIGGSGVMDNRSTFIESTDLVFVPNKGTEPHLAQEGRGQGEKRRAIKLVIEIT